jgi:general secretion pathway protein L
MQTDRTTTTGAFLRWWGGQLADLAPARRTQASRRLVLAIEGERVRVLREDGGQLAPAGTADAVDAAELGERLEAARGASLPLGLRVSLDQCFVRSVELPSVARARFGEILRLDLERATPFRSADILTAFNVPAGRAAGPMTRVRQLVLKREVVAPWIERLAALGRPVTFIDCWDEEGARALDVDFLAAAGPESRPAADARPRLVLAALCVGLAVYAGWTFHARQAEALAGLTARTSEARSKAVAAQRTLDIATGLLGDLKALRQATTGRVSVTEVLDTLTRLLPDQAFVQDLRIEADVIEIAGLAQGGAALLTILERSSLFSETTLTAPLILDPAAGRERFAIRMRLRPAKDGLPAARERP